MSGSVKISGRRFPLPAPKVEGTGSWKFTMRPGGWILAERALPDGSVQRRRLALWESSGGISASIRGRLFAGEKGSATSRRRSDATESGDRELVAQFPGRVRKILVEEGARVQEGDPLLMVEAMKMEFAVKSPVSGTIAKVLVTEGQQLNPGDRFFDLDEAVSDVQ